MVWLIMVVSYTQVAGYVIEFFNSLLFCANKPKGCLVFVTKRFVTIDEFSSGGIRCEETCKKMLIFLMWVRSCCVLAVGRALLTQSGREAGPKGADYSLYQVKRPLKVTDYALEYPLSLYRTEINNE
jgi:hypothetical protein